MADEPKCEDGGYLVGMKYPIPTSIAERYRGGLEYLGCNRIYCPSCSSWVRHVDRRQLGDPPRTRAEHEWLYENLETAGEPMLLMNTGAGSNAVRVYACRCSIDSCSKLLELMARETDWYCAGHPAAV